MESPPQQHKHVHPEVVHLKDLGLGEEEHEDTDELCESDTTDHRGPHVGQSIVCPLSASGKVAGAEPTDDVGTKLHRNTNSLHRQQHQQNNTLRTQWNLR